MDENNKFQPEVIFEGGDGKAELAPKGPVTAKVLSHVKGDKIRIGRPARRTGYQHHTGYRSNLDPDPDRVDRREEEHHGSINLRVALDHCNEDEGRRLMAHKKGLGSSRNGRDSMLRSASASKDLRRPGREGRDDPRPPAPGARSRPGADIGLGRDDTIFAARDGRVEFKRSGERRTVTSPSEPQYGRQLGRDRRPAAPSAAARVQRSGEDPHPGRPGRPRSPETPAARSTSQRAGPTVGTAGAGRHRDRGRPRPA